MGKTNYLADLCGQVLDLCRADEYSQRTLYDDQLTLHAAVGGDATPSYHCRERERERSTQHSTPSYHCRDLYLSYCRRTLRLPTTVGTFISPTAVGRYSYGRRTLRLRTTVGTFISPTAAGRYSYGRRTLRLRTTVGTFIRQPSLSWF
jgi:hypothetical protein